MAASGEKGLVVLGAEMRVLRRMYVVVERMVGVVLEAVSEREVEGLIGVIVERVVCVSVMVEVCGLEAVFSV